MHRLILNVKLLSLLAAVVVAVVAAGSLGAPRHAEANDVADPTGVICGYLHDLELNGSPFNFSGTVLVRIDDDGSSGDFRITAVAYTTEINSTSSMPDCKTPQDTNFPGDVIPPTGGEVRPSVSGLTFDAAAHDLAGSSCQEDFVFAGETFADWTLITLQLDFSQTEPTPQSMGSFAFETLYATEAACNAGGNPETVTVLFDALYQSGPNADSSNFTSDWDKDGCTDWNELNADPQAQHLDPFAADCGVGGVAQLPDVATAPLDTAGSSGSNAGLIATLVAIAAAAATTMGAGALYARKRLTR